MFMKYIYLNFKNCLSRKRVPNHVLHMAIRIIEVFKKYQGKQEILIRNLVSCLFLRKRHKHIKSGIPFFRPILATLGALAYKLVKLVVTFLAL